MQQNFEQQLPQQANDLNNKKDEKIIVNSIKETKSWEKYENSIYEMPYSPVSQGSSYYLYRWRIWSPLNKRIFYAWTVGEIIFLLIMLACIAVAMPVTYCNPCDEQNSGKANIYESAALYKNSGDVATFPMLVCFLFATRNSIWTFLFGITFERQLMWHKILAVITVGMALYHGLLAIFNITGWITFGCLAALLFFSLPPFRRKMFEFFYRVHWILFLGVAVFGLIHGAGVGVIGFGGNIIDFILRRKIVNRNQANSFEVSAVQLPADVIRIIFAKGTFNYKAGQYVFICVPELSHLEWHPFSLSSSPHQENVSIHIRVLGDWTTRLQKIVGTTERKLQIWMDGPYGNPAIDIDGDKYKVFMMISGGIGITPMQSITNELLEQYSRGRPLKKLYFIWSVRDLFMVSTVQNHDVKYLEKNIPKKLPLSFQPDLLDINNPKNLSLKDVENILDSRFFLTQMKQKDEKQLAECNILPAQMPYLQFGRPNLRKLFEEVQQKATELGESRVAVLCCGPAQLVEDVIQISQSIKPIKKIPDDKADTDPVQFDVHEELFDF